MKTLWEDIKRLRGANWWVALIMLALLCIGVAAVYSSCHHHGQAATATLHIRQIKWIVVGFACHVVLAAVDYRRLGKVAWWGYGATLVLLMAVFIHGDAVMGAQRRIDLAGLTIQPSEFAKLALILLLAWLLSRPNHDFGKWRSFLGLMAVALIPMALIFKQPDLGTTIVFVPVVGVLLLVAGFSLVPVFCTTFLVLAAVAAVFCAAYIPQKLNLPEEEQLRIWSHTLLSPYQRDRILTFVNGDKDVLNKGWNKKQSMIAVGSGGLTGKGWTRGTQNVLGFLPRSVAPTDFIYSVIAEEHGFVGSATVVSLFAGLVLAGFSTAFRARDRFGRLLCAGVLTLLSCHALVNIGMTVGVFPITGLPLPFLSYGGSFMVVCMSAMGILQSVHIRSKLPRQEIG